MKYCDLHTHTCFSDGTMTPAQLVAEAEAVGLTAVALCDHNTISGLPEFMQAGKSSPVETIPGIEFSTEYKDTELHLVMLFVKPSDHAAITGLLAEFRERKEQSNLDMVRALQRDGYHVDYDKLRQAFPGGYLNRAHIAAELVKLGHAGSVKEAFSRYLVPNGPYFTPPARLSFLDAVDFIRDLGGVSVLAHPFLNLEEEELCALLPIAKEHGLDAMETMYSRYDRQTTATAKAIARRYGLLQSGGSDFHGANKPDIQLGVGMGDLQIDAEILEKLKEKTGKYGKAGRIL